MSRQGGRDATERVREAVGADVLRVLEQGLSSSDLTTLLVSVASARAAEVLPARMLSTSASDRFTRPARSDPRALAAAEARLWQSLPAAIDGIELAPVAPLGVCSALAGVAQSRVVSTVRGSEVVSDATNVLALKAARRRRGGWAEVHLAASHRVLRAQHFQRADASSHFRLFNLVSSTRDRGSGTTEAGLVVKHLEAWQAVLQAVLPAFVPWHVDLTVFRPGPVSERLLDSVLPTLERRGIRVRERAQRTGADYYTDCAFKIMAGAENSEVELGDGGLTDWTARLLSDAKERCLISCIAIERLVELAGDD